MKMADDTYALVFRRYAPFKSFGGGFEGDTRKSASTRDDASHRTSAVIRFNRSGVLNTSGSSSGTEWLVGGKKFANVTVKVTNFEQQDKGVFIFQATSAGSNPLVPGAPDIDTRVLFGAAFSRGYLGVNGFVSGDGFPNCEVFIKGPKGGTMLLVDYRTSSSGTTGPATRLPGANFDN
jgi:hypothetical protein